MTRALRVFAISVALALGGCGGAMRRDELRRGVETIGAQAAEGALLARGVAQDRTRSTFTRVHARELAEGASHEAEKLHDARAQGDLADDKAAAVTLAQDVAGALGELQVAAGDERDGARLQQRLDRLSSDAARLAGGL